MADAQSQRLAAELHVGTMGWSYSFWKGNFYPKELASKDFLAYYAKHLGTVEVDSTFYRIPRTQTITEWHQQTPNGFLFSLKFPQKITHIKMLQNCEEETQVFLERADLLGEKLGVLLLQFPPMFRQRHFPLLAAYLKALPKRYRYAVEVRNKSLLTKELYGLLKEQGVALVWVDAAKMPLAAEVTADFLYVRWEGDRKAVMGTTGKTETDRAKEIQVWTKRVQPFWEKHIPVFGYFSKYYSGNPTGDAQEFLKQAHLLASPRQEAL
ncbi:MAG: DUF72 domain-containing protein [Candidatus Bathyarchaeota archaeon]|nr:DUF72 domain-containing protein [Candidatus Bathyarchaeota archaeon]